MTNSLPDGMYVEYRLVLIEPQSMRILTRDTVEGPMLPRESVSAYTRIAQTLTEAIEQRYGFSSLQLAILPAVEGNSDCAVHEIIGPTEDTPGSFSFLVQDEITLGELSDEEKAFVLKILKGETNALGKFARLGWITDLLTKTGRRPSDDHWPTIRQFNQSVDFCLLSWMSDEGHKLWFKAVGKPNTREYALTAELSRRFPKYLPTILLDVPEWNGWVMEDVQGVPLNESDDIHHCEDALAALAIMQKEMVCNVDSLASLGARTWSCTRIASLSEQFFTEARHAMRAQTSTKALPLSGSELFQLQRNIDVALNEFMDPRIPDTLLHGDIGHGNVIATSCGPVFLDWAETYIGHPFICAEHLLADLARSNRLFADRQATLRSFYADQWRTHLLTAELKRISLLAPAVAAFAYGVIAWETFSDRNDPEQVWPLLRSMLRRAKGELHKSSGVMA